MNKEQQRIKWNTGRTYTEHGQRMAAQAYDNGVVMVDIDRGIHYFLPDCGLNQNEIMSRYDRNDRCKYSPDVNPDYVALRQLRSDLEEYAV